MQKVEGSNPFSRFQKGAHLQAFSCSSRVVRLRHRTMTGQSCPRRLADAVGRCSLAGDSERPAPWNFCVPAEDRDRPRREVLVPHRHPSALSVVAVLPSSRSRTPTIRSCSSSEAGASAALARALPSTREKERTHGGSRTRGGGPACDSAGRDSSWPAAGSRGGRLRSWSVGV